MQPITFKTDSRVGRGIARLMEKEEQYKKRTTIIIYLLQFITVVIGVYYGVLSIY